MPGNPNISINIIINTNDGGSSNITVNINNNSKSNNNNNNNNNKTTCEQMAFPCVGEENLPQALNPKESKPATTDLLLFGLETLLRTSSVFKSIHKFHHRAC